MTKEKKVELTDEQKALLSGYSKEEIADVLKMEADEREDFFLDLKSMNADTAKLDGQIKTIDALSDDNKGKNYVPGGLVIRENKKFIAQFIGLEYLFSKEAKENWETVKTEDGSEVRYRSKTLKFRRTDGTIFGVFYTPMMGNILRSVLTRTSGAAVAKDPAIEFTYLGKVSKDVAAKEFNFTMSQGDSTHAWDIKLEADHRKGTGRGFLNQLNSPLPIGSSDSDLTADEVNMKNFKVATQSLDARAQVEGAHQEQIAH